MKAMVLKFRSDCGHKSPTERRPVLINRRKRVNDYPVKSELVRLTLRSLYLLVLLGVVGGLFGCTPKRSAKLNIGMELNYPPFETVDPQGQPAGISVQIAEALGKYLDREIQIQNIPFDGLIPALKTSKIDLIISSMTETPERAQSIDFSEPYLRTGLCVLVSKGIAIDSINQLDKPDFSIVVKQGTTGQHYAQEHLKRARLLVLEKEDACVLEVSQGKAQAFLYDQMSILKHWQRHKETTRALLKPFQEEQWAIGLRKNEKSLKGQVNAFLKSFRSQSGFERLGDRYLKEQKADFQQMNIPFIL